MTKDQVIHDLAVLAAYESLQKYDKTDSYDAAAVVAESYCAAYKELEKNTAIDDLLK